MTASPLFAGVVVVQNWTTAKISFTVQASDGQPTHYTVTPTDIAAIPADAPVTIVLGEGAGAVARQAAVNSIHYLAARDGKLDLVHLKLPGVEEKLPPPATPPPAPPQAPPAPQPPGIYKIPVAILFDTADAQSRAVWEKKLRKRMDECSDIFEHHCRVRFEVVSVGTWQSNPSVHSFEGVLTDFGQKVRPGPARVAIGFTSRYDWMQDESHLGETHGTLASHILIREPLGGVSEPERLEVLVHELGHFLGAAHTSDQNSVMRPKLGDRRSTAKSFRIGFDAPNTLVINLIAEEMRTRRLWHPSLLTADSKAAVRGAYTVLAQTIPRDPVSTSSLESLGPAPQADKKSIVSPEVLAGARFVVQAIAQAARENGQLPVSSTNPKAQLWRTGDELMSYYVRRAAAAARHWRPEVAPSVFLLGLGVALDESNYVHGKPELGDLWKEIEPEEQRQTRMLLMGTPTIRKQHTLVGRFTMSAALTVISGPQGAEAAGLGKEVLDSRSGDSFSFVNLCADMSGVLFATHVREGNIPLEQVAKGFSVEDYVPSIDSLPDDISWEKFQKDYGEGGSEKFQRQRRDIYRSILELPPYRAPQGKK